jgi:antitoxin (DNA-binding transcriptional repressor) of toxin-antitoxin stability system
MMKATTKDLRLHTREILAAADRGDTVVITYRGACRAVLRRWEPEDGQSMPERNPAFGMWSDLDGDVAQHVRRLREPRPLP